MKRILCIIQAAVMVVVPLAAQVKGGGTVVADVVRQYDDGEYAKAASMAATIVRNTPGNDAAWYYLGMSSFAIETAGGDAPGDAAAFLHKAVALDSANYWYRDRLAQVYLYRGEIDAAKAQYESMLGDFPGKTDILYSLVNIYLQEGDFDSTLRTIDDIEAVAGKSDPTVMTRYRILLSRQQQAEALAVLEEYAEDYSSPQVLALLGDHNMGMYNDSTALAYYDKALALDRDYAPALIGKAEAYRMTRRYSEYFDLVDAVMSNQEAVPAAKADYLSQVTQRSDSRFLQNFSARIDSAWSKAVAMHPADSSVLTGAGIWYYRTGRAAEAADMLGRWAALAPGSLGARVTYLQAIAGAEQYDRLDVEAAKASEDFPREPGLLEFSSLARYNKKDYKGVVEVCEKMISMAPKDSAVCLGAYTTIGDLSHLLGEKEKCYKAYKKALKINPAFAPVLNNYSWYLAMDGRQLGLAAKMARQAVAQEPDNATYLDTLGWILHLQGKDSEAKPIFKHAMLYGGKESAVILMHYSRVLDKLGESDLAKVYKAQAEAKAATGGEEEDI